MEEPLMSSAPAAEQSVASMRAEREPCRCAVSAAAAALLDQCAEFVRSVPARRYTEESRRIRGGTIGKHVRHTLDHFRACLDGAEPGQVADYDHRQRNVPMELDPARALAAIGELSGRLAKIDDARLRAPMRVRVMLTGDGVYAELSSTLGRELAFATHHAVHHHAMLGAIAAELGLQTPPDFGKAPSTIHHDREAR